MSKVCNNKDSISNLFAVQRRFFRKVTQNTHRTAMCLANSQKRLIKKEKKSTSKKETTMECVCSYGTRNAFLFN